MYDSSTIAIPSLYLRDWPDIYIHTDHDTLTQLDATKLRRVALLGAAAGYTYASLGAMESSRALPFFSSRSMQRLASASERAAVQVQDPAMTPDQAWYEARNILTQLLGREEAELESFATYTKSKSADVAPSKKMLEAQVALLNQSIDAAAVLHGATSSPADTPSALQGDSKLIATRIGEIGPLTYQNGQRPARSPGPGSFRQDQASKWLVASATPAGSSCPLLLRDPQLC